VSRILFVSTMGGDAWGGSEELWARSAVRLVREGHSVFASVAAWEPLHPRVRALEAAGVQILPRRFRAAPLLRRILGRLGNRPVEAPSPFLHALVETQPHLVIVSNGGIWPPRDLADGLLARRDAFVTLGQAAHLDQFPSDEDLAVFRDYFGAAREVLFVSHGNVALTEHQLAERITNARVVRNPFNVPYDADIAWPAGPDEPVRFASVARLHIPSKGQDLLLTVLAQPQWRERNWRLSLFGGGPHREVIGRHVERLGLRDRVDFRGHVDDVTSIWREHHALVLPSRYEGLPLALVEAMLCARPVIATDVAGNTEMVEDGVTGFVAQRADVEAVAAAMENAWAARSHWEAIGKRAAHRARELVSPDPAADFANLLAHALEEVSPSRSSQGQGDQRT
jgi:glycosyltransferase involved in cell wall biosynthesis